jgi:hypothetical protein
MLSGHALLIAAIFVPYFVMMAALGLYMWCQVRRHLSEDEEQPPDSGEDEGGGDLGDLAAAA